MLITGANGFVGQHLSRALIARGWSVRALVRAAAPGLAPQVEQHVAKGLDDRPAIQAALAGAEAVVHLAARVHVMRERSGEPLSEFRRTNVEGTRLLAEASLAAGARTFVFSSSIKVMGQSSGLPFSESDAPRPADPYGQSKLEAEQLLEQVAASSGLRVAMLRLPLVYGPGVRANMLALFRAVDRGLPLPFAGVHNQRSLLYSGNLSEAVHALLLRPPEGARSFFVSDGEDVSTSGLLSKVGEALGRPARLLPFPGRLLTAVARVGDRIPAGLRFPVRTAVLERLVGSLAVNQERLLSETAYRPRFSVAEGLRDTAVWYRSTASAGRA